MGEGGIDLLFLTCFPAVSYSFECVKINVTQIVNVTFIIIPLTYGQSEKKEGGKAEKSTHEGNQGFEVKS